MKVFLNNRILDERDANISVFDHSFLYGDGLYETVSARDYRVRFWFAHARRFRHGLRTLALACPLSMADLERAVIRTLRANRRPNASARITLSRGPGPLGLDPTACRTPTLVILLHPDRPLDQWRANGVSLSISTILHEPANLITTSIKSNAVLSAVLAKAEAQKWKAFEAIRLNAQGYLTEGTTTNLFFVRLGRLYTPSISCGLLSGITRGRVLQLAKRLKLLTFEGRYSIQDLRRAEEIFLTNTTFGVLPVVTLISRKNCRPVSGGNPGRFTLRLQQLLER